MQSIRPLRSVLYEDSDAGCLYTMGPQMVERIDSTLSARTQL